MFSHLSKSARLLIPGLALVAELLLSTAGAQSVVGGFDPAPNGTVYAMARQPDGKIIVGGTFVALQPNALGDAWDRGRIARINTDGSVDPGFHAAFNGDVTLLARQADGKILVAGRFTTVANIGSAPVARNGLARLNVDGSLDASFDPNPAGNTFPLGLVRSMVVQADGRIVIGGGFTSLQPNGATTPTVRNRLARLNADGTVDTSFNPNVNNVVLALALQQDGRILAGGAFTTIQPAGASAATTVSRLVRLNTNGTLDTAFTPSFDERVLALAIEVDGAILVGGEFQTIKSAGDAAETKRPFFARLRPNGVFDATINAVPSAPVSTIAVQADGRILLGGRFTSIYFPTTREFSSRNFIARLNPSGTVDPVFTVFPTSIVHAFVVQPDNSVVFGGSFSRVVGSGGGSNELRTGLARVQSNGALDTGFTPDSGGQISVAVRQADGKMIYGGAFNSFAGVPRSGIVRVDASGVVDAAFKPSINGTVSAVAIQPDGKILVGGSFTRVNDVDRLFIARLNADGTTDSAFDPKANGGVERIVVHTDGKIYVTGSFSTFTPNGTTTAIARTTIARLNSDGTVDSTYDPNPNSSVITLAVQSDGAVLIGGVFTAFRPNGTTTTVSRPYFAKLTPTGAIDDKFTITPNTSVSSIAVQADGKFILGGAFTAVVPVGATTSTVRNRVARFNADGTLDTAFDPNFDASVARVSALSDGRIIVTGGFTALLPNGATTAVRRNRFAWLESNGTLTDSRAIQFDGDVIAVLGSASDVLFAGGFSRIFTSGNFGLQADSHAIRFKLDGSLDTTFTPAAGSALTGYAGAIAVESGGRFIVGGSFEGLNGSTNRNLTRIGTDGSPDTSFFAKPNAAVNAVVVRRVETEFTPVGGPAAVLNSSGTFLSTFSPTLLSSITGSIRSFARQSDGKLIVAGNFVGTTAANPHLMRFNADGSVDPAFNPAPDLEVYAVALQSDGKILFGGAFQNVGGVARSRLGRLNADGTLDTAFNPAPNGTIFRIVVQGDGKILIGGSFSQLQPNGAATATTRSNIARLNADGTLDTAFSPTTNGTVDTIAVQSDNAILIGGSFSTVGSTARSAIARLKADGSIDTTFDPKPDNRVIDIAVQSDGKILVGGAFFRFAPNGATTPIDRPSLARLNADGTLDDTFKPAPDASISSIAVQSDGKILIGGSFSFFLPDANKDPIFRNSLARLNADGSVDPVINTIPDGIINVIRLFPDGTFAIGGNHTSLFPDPNLFVGGEFTAMSETSVTRLARLYRNGLVDIRFTAAPNAAVHALAQQPDGNLIVAGAFTEISGTARQRLARMDIDGVLDATFNPAANATVRTVVLLPGGRILAGGEFTTIAGASRGRIAVLNSNGSIDASFNATVDGPVNAAVALPNGGFVIAGEFQTVNGTARTNVARLNADGTLDASFSPSVNGLVWSVALLGDGRVVIGGAFTQVGGSARRGLARLNTNGSLDTTLTVQPDNDVLAVYAQQDGRLIVGGRFSKLGGRTSGLLGAISGTGGASQALAVDSGLSTATYTIGGAAGDFSAVRFQFSTDFTEWSDLGVGQRSGASGAWQITGLNFPADSIYYLRVIGTVSSSRFGSMGTRDVVAQFYGSVAAGTSASSPPSDGTSGSSGGGSSSPGDGSSSGGGAGSGGSSGGSSGGGTGSGGSGSAGGGSTSTTVGMSNLSSRGWPQQGEPLIAGFVVGGSSAQTVLLRGVGPGLGQFGVADAMATPALRIYNSTGALVAQAGTWGGTAELISTFGTVGAFALDPASADSAVALTLNPGAYTVHVTDGGSLGGIALGELYLVSGAGVANVSVRGPAGTGNAALIAGFVVDTEQPQRLLVRGVGPGLSAFGVAGVIADPVLRVFDSTGALIAENDNWSTQTSISSADMTAQIAGTGAFALPAGSKDSAVFVTLPKGSYTVHVTGPAGGAALVEVYAAP